MQGRAGASHPPPATPHWRHCSDLAQMDSGISTRPAAD